MQDQSDLACLGASLLPTRELLRVLLRRRRVDEDVLAAAEHALSLAGPAREAALRDLQDARAGVAVLAAVELGRRAWQLPSARGRRVRGPADVAAIARPHFSCGDDEATLVLALDLRMRVARIAAASITPIEALRVTLGAGCARFVAAWAVAGPAVPGPAHVDAAARLQDAARIVGAACVDAVLLGDDGHASLVRLGLMSACEPRYR